MTYVTAAMFQHAEKMRFDALEPEHVAQLEKERVGRNSSQLRYLERLLAENGMTNQADDLLAIRNDCASRGIDTGSDRRIQNLLDDVKNNATDPILKTKLRYPYFNISDLIDRINWIKLRSCWDFWKNIVSISDYRLISITITGRPDGTILEFKEKLDGLRDRVVSALRPLANWYSWHLDVSLVGDSRHPHYHCLFVVPATMDRAVFDAVDDLKKHAFWKDEGLYVQYRDWLEYDRRRPMLDVAGRQRSWIAALAYATRVISHRPLPRGEYAPTLSSFLDVDDHVGQIRQEWDGALQEVLKRNAPDKAVGARRMALFLRKESGRKVVSFRQSKRWKSFKCPLSETTSSPGYPRPDANDSNDDGTGSSWLAQLEAAVPLHQASLRAVADEPDEHGSTSMTEELEQNYPQAAGEPATDDVYLPSMVVKKGFKENLRKRPKRDSVGRPPREISHQELMLAVISGGSCTAAAALLGTSTRKIRQGLEDAGIGRFPRGRPRTAGSRRPANQPQDASYLEAQALAAAPSRAAVEMSSKRSDSSR